MTAMELVALWSERQERYELHRRYRLSQEETVAVMQWRRWEMAVLPASERAAAYKQWVSWLPG